MRFWAIRLGAALSVVVVAAAIFVLATGGSFHQSPVVAATNTTQTVVDESVITGIYAAASPAVVEITVTSHVTGLGGYSMSGQGSGFVIDSDGHILTNNHVVDGATSVQVIFSDGRKVSATVLGKDAADDLAIVKVNASDVAGITPLTLADSSQVKPGQLAIALGSPYGLTNSITVGVISGLNRSVSGSTLSGMIQTDANIQPGNSGGPLLNSNGQVVGINTAFEGQGTGIGFAVPSNVASGVLSDLKASKQIQKPWIGISGLALDESTAQEIGLSVSKGVYVVSMVSGSPADKAGLQAARMGQNGNPGKDGDIITAIDGRTVATVQDIQSYLATKKVGDTVTLTVLRAGSSISVQVTLAARPADTSSTTPQDTPSFPDIPGFQWPWGNR